MGVLLLVSVRLWFSQGWMHLFCKIVVRVSARVRGFAERPLHSSVALLRLLLVIPPRPRGYLSVYFLASRASRV